MNWHIDDHDASQCYACDRLQAENDELRVRLATLEGKALWDGLTSFDQNTIAKIYPVLDLIPFVKVVRNLCGVSLRDAKTIGDYYRLVVQLNEITDVDSRSVQDLVNRLNT